jgi:hypothetical protein
VPAADLDSPIADWRGGRRARRPSHQARPLARSPLIAAGVTAPCLATQFTRSIQRRRPPEHHELGYPRRPPSGPRPWRCASAAPISLLQLGGGRRGGRIPGPGGRSRQFFIASISAAATVTAAAAALTQLTIAWTRRSEAERRVRRGARLVDLTISGHSSSPTGRVRSGIRYGGGHLRIRVKGGHPWKALACLGTITSPQDQAEAPTPPDHDSRGRYAVGPPRSEAEAAMSPRREAGANTSRTARHTWGGRAGGVRAAKPAPAERTDASSDSPREAPREIRSPRTTPDQPCARAFEERERMFIAQRCPAGSGCRLRPVPDRLCRRSMIPATVK